MHWMKEGVPRYIMPLIAGKWVVQALTNAGTNVLHRDYNWRTPLEALHEMASQYNHIYINSVTFVMLVASEDRNWYFVPVP